MVCVYIHTHIVTVSWNKHWTRVYFKVCLGQDTQPWKNIPFQYTYFFSTFRIEAPLRPILMLTFYEFMHRSYNQKQERQTLVNSPSKEDRGHTHSFSSHLLSIQRLPVLPVGWWTNDVVLVPLEQYSCGDTGEKGSKDINNGRHS